MSNIVRDYEIHLTLPDDTLTVTLENYHVGAPPYTGEYIVNPKAYSKTVLETKHKEMQDNVIVNEIPFYEVGNGSGGHTIYIGSEVTYG